MVESFDIAVGLKKQIGQTWHPWCFQRRCGAGSLADTYTRLAKEMGEREAELAANFSHWFSLQTPLGDDSFLLSTISVASVKRSGRDYFSLRVTRKHELCGTVIFFVQEAPNNIRDREMRLVTGPYSVDEPFVLRQGLVASDDLTDEQICAVRTKNNYPPDDMEPEELASRIGVGPDFPLHLAVLHNHTDELCWQLVMGSPVDTATRGG